MAYKTKFDGTTDKTIQLGGTSATGERNPTSLEGYFLGSKDTQSDYGPGKLHIFQTKEGTVGVWGKTRLNTLLTEELKGQMCLVSFTGMVAPSKKGRKPSYGYKVQHDEDNRTDVSNVNLNAAAPAEEDDGEASYDSDQNDENNNAWKDAPSGYQAKVPASAPTAAQVSNVQARLNKMMNKSQVKSN